VGSYVELFIRFYLHYHPLSIPFDGQPKIKILWPWPGLAWPILAKRFVLRGVRIFMFAEK
jgi:hypothetical protein